MSGAVYARFELLRTVRNRRFFIFSLAFPLVLFFAVASGNRHAIVDGIKFPLYYMTGMAAWGSMNGITAGGARIALERTAGWTRQMRITPLSTRTYFGTKILSGYLIGAISIALLYLAGTSLGVSLSASGWLTMTGLLLVGLIPFAVLGILLGHLLKPEALLPAVAGTTTLLALLGGAYGFLVATSGPVFEVIRALPSYWLVQAGKTALGHGGWPAEGWIVIAAWTAVLVPLTVLAYRRDTSRV